MKDNKKTDQKVDREKYRLKNKFVRVAMTEETKKELLEFIQKHHPKLPIQAYFELLLEKETGIKFE